MIANFDRLRLAHSGIIAITMPVFGAAAPHPLNAEKLAELLGAEPRGADW